MKLLHDIELNCSGNMSTFAVNDDGSQLIVGLDLVSINGPKDHMMRPLAEALPKSELENVAYEVAGNTISHQPSIEVEDFQFHPKGDFLGFSYNNLPERSAGLGIFDVKLWRLAWSWSTKVDLIGSSTIFSIMYTFHPALPQVAWGVEGLQVAICDFSSRKAPRVLPCEYCHKWNYLTDFIGG